MSDFQFSPFSWVGEYVSVSGHDAMKTVGDAYAYRSVQAVFGDVSFFVEKEFSGLCEYMIALSCCGGFFDGEGKCSTCGSSYEELRTNSHWGSEVAFRAEAEELVEKITDPLSAFLWIDELVTVLNSDLVV